MGVLSNIQGKVGEDISTEILAYFLSPEDGIAPFQRLLFSHILGDSKSSEELDVQIRTQVDLGIGVPDLIMFLGNGETLVILENKLGAYLSGDSQLLRYAEAFKKEKEIRRYFSVSMSAAVNRKVLVFLAPRKSIDISLSITEKAFKKKYHSGFKEFLNDNRIEFQKIEWEKVIGWLDKKDCFQNELFRFVEDFLSLELTKGEAMALQDPETPLGLFKLFRNILAIANEVSAKEWKIGRMTQSYLWYGFNIETGMTRLYFGYSLPLWPEFGTPVILQAKPADFKLDDKNLVLSRLTDNGFKFGKGDKLFRPFKIETIDNWKKELFEILDSLKSEEPSKSVS